MEEDDMHRLHPTFPSNADLIAAGNNGIQLTNEQHRILTSQLEGSTFIYNVPENRQRVEGSEPYLGMTNEERAALMQAHDALHFGIRLKGTNATDTHCKVLIHIIEQHAMRVTPQIITKMASYDHNQYKHLPKFGYFVYNCYFPNKSVKHSKTPYMVPEDYKDDNDFLQHYHSLRLSRNTDIDYVWCISPLLLRLRSIRGPRI